MTVEPDGKVVFGIPAPQQSFALIRLDPNGNLDTSFGQDGMLTTAIRGDAMAVQSNGDIVVAGSIGSGHKESDIAAVRYQPNGELDRSFGQKGLVRLTSTSEDSADAVVVQPSGTIAVIGSYFGCEMRCRFERDGRGLGSVLGEGNGIVLARLSRAGKLIGAPTVATGSEVNELAVGATGELAALSFWGGEESDEGLASAVDRYHTNGTLAQSFGNPAGIVGRGDGQLVIDTTEHQKGIPKSLALQPDGKVVLGGFTAGSGGVARLNADGSTDTSFGSNGSAFCPGGQLNGAATGVSVLPDGRLLVGGETGCGIARHLANGTPDPSFGGDGRIDPEPQLGAAPEALAQGPGATVLATAWERLPEAPGRYTFGSLRVARYLEDGALDPSFGKGGVVSVDPTYASQDVATSIARQPDGKLIAVGTTDSETVAIARYLPDGQLDRSFGINGEVTTALSESPPPATPLAVQPDGKAIVADQTQIARYLPDGELDPSFGTAGMASSAGAGNTEALALAANGDIYAAIQIHGSGGSSVSRYLPDGTLDTNFGKAGVARIEGDGAASENYAKAIAIQPDGRILVAGDATGGVSVVRLMPKGRPDHSFGEGGVIRARFYRRRGRGHPHVLEHLKARLRAMALAPNGDILIGGLSGLNEPRLQHGFIARYLPDGRLDRRFGNRGITQLDHFQVNALGLNKCGRIEVAGSYVSGSIHENFGVAQLSPNGEVLGDSRRNPMRVPLGDFGDDRANALVLTPTGFVAAGVAPVSGQANQFALAAFRSSPRCGR